MAQWLPTEFPTVVCLCGSTRFYREFQEANYRETMAGRIVLSVGFYPHSSELVHGQAVGCDDDQKQALDRLHFRKIEMADEVLVINPLAQVCPRCGSVWAKGFGNSRTLTVLTCGCRQDLAKVPHAPYIGESTRREIEHARRLGKVIRWLEAPHA